MIAAGLIAAEGSPESIGGRSVELEGLTVTRPTLENVYLELTNTDGA